MTPSATRKPPPKGGFALEAGAVKLSKIGAVKAVIHRPISGRVKTCCVRRTATGKWFACFSCEVEAEPVSASAAAVGIDVGLATFATLSTGEAVPNPRFFRRDERALAKAQRRLAKTEKGTPERAKRRQVVARIHERIANRRTDFAHQTARKLVKRFGVIAVEDLAVNRMVHHRCLAKSMGDAAWAQFIAILSFKAASAGRTLVAVNPAYTSQTCSRCGHRQRLALADRVFRCLCCGRELDRDHNAALTILSLGLQALGASPGSPCL